MPGNGSELAQYACACGASIKAPATAVGRKARCPKCGDKFTLNPVRRERSARRQSGSSDTGTVKVACGCGQRVKVPGNYAGRRVKCPRCREAVLIPGSDRRETAPTAPEPSPADELDALLGGLSVGEPIAFAPEDQQAPVETNVGTSAAPAVMASRGKKNKMCPSCEEMHYADTKICAQCGINIDTGRAIITTSEAGLDRAYVVTESTLNVLSYLIPWGYFPVASEGFGVRTPWIIRAIGVTTILISGWFMLAYIYNPNPAPRHADLMLWSSASGDKVEAARAILREEGFSPEEIDVAIEEDLSRVLDEIELRPHRGYQLITHAFLHGGIFHLLGNMLFLFVLGSRVNALIGNLLTLIIYPLLAALAALIYLAMTPTDAFTPMLGASGAIMGLAGMYLVFLPQHPVHMAAWFRWAWWSELHLKMWPVRGFWVVLFYIAWDVLYTIIGLEDGVAHWAHLGGFIAGMVIALVLLATPLVNARGGDLLTAILGRHAWNFIGRPNRQGFTLP